MISIGAGEELVSEYRSVIFYHVGKPEWVETIKVNHKEMSRIKERISTNMARSGTLLSYFIQRCASSRNVVGCSLKHFSMLTNHRFVKAHFMADNTC